jgi:tetratricopeptide (TPR) repeat protein
MAVTLPVVLVILDIYPLERLNLKRPSPSQCKVWLEKLPFLGLSLASSLVTIVAQRAGGAVLNYLPLGTRILGSIRGLCFCLVKMVWPIGLAPLYPHPARISLSNPEYMSSLVLVIGMTVFCIWLWPRQRIWAAVWAYYIVTLLPVLGIIQVGPQAAADRYTYLPSLGPFLLAGLGVAWGWEKAVLRRHWSMHREFIVIIPSILIITLLANLTTKQIRVWRNSISLWDSELKQFPDRVPLAYYNRGVTYARLGNYQRAIKDFDKFIELNPQYVRAYSNRGLAYAKKGQYEEAISDYKQVLKINPDNINAYNYLGYLYIDKEIDLEEGLRLIKKALSLAPENASIIGSLGWAYYKKGMFDEALEELERAIKLGGDKVNLHEHLAKVYEKKEKYEEAMKAWKKVLEINPQHREAQKSLTRLSTLIRE